MEVMGETERDQGEKYEENRRNCERTLKGQKVYQNKDKCSL